MHAARWIALTLPVLALVAACSSGSSASSDSNDSTASGWTSAADVLAGLKSADISCLASGLNPEIDASAADRGIAYIPCEKFAVMLILDQALYSDLDNCKGTELLNWDAADKQRVVVGSNFVVTPVVTGDEAIPAFPDDAPASGFVDAFGANEVSVTDWMTQQGCVRPSA